MASWMALAAVPAGLLVCSGLFRRSGQAPAASRRSIVLEAGPEAGAEDAWNLWKEVPGLTRPEAEELLDRLERLGVTERELGPVSPAGFVVRYR
jgi:hypothetical protein